MTGLRTESAPAVADRDLGSVEVSVFVARHHGAHAHEGLRRCLRDSGVGALRSGNEWRLRRNADAGGSDAGWGGRAASLCR